VVLVIVVVFDATSLLPAVAPVDHGILPPLGGDTRRCDDGDHGGGIPPTARGGTTNVGGGGGRGCGSGNPKRRMTREMTAAAAAAEVVICQSRLPSMATTRITSAVARIECPKG
jgi:hypothetical protein